MTTEHYADNCRASLGAAIVEITEERMPALIERAYTERVDACDFCWWALRTVRAVQAQPAPVPAPAVQASPSVSGSDVRALRRDAAAACAAFVAAVAGRTATVSVPVIAEHLDTLVPDVLRLFLRRREEAAALDVARAVEKTLGCYAAVDMRDPDDITVDLTNGGGGCTLAAGQVRAWDSWHDESTDGDPDSLDTRAEDIASAARDARQLSDALESRAVKALLDAWREVCQ